MATVALDGRVRDRVRVRLAAPLLVLGYAAAVVALGVAGHERSLSALGGVLLPLAWLVAATLAVRARPEHPGPLLFLGLGVAHLVGAAISLPLAYDVGLGGWGAWTLDLVATMAETLGFASLAVFLATFPTGVARSGLERWFVRLVAPVVLGLAVVSLLTSSPVALVADGSRSSMSPPAGLPLARWSLPAGPLVSLVVVVGVVLLVVRGRRLRGMERRQLSWAIGAGGLLALMLLASPALGVLWPTVQSVSFVVVASVLPFALLAGLVRYRLLEVEMYLTRTLARGAVVVLVLSAYAAVVLATERLGGGVGVPAAALALLVALSGRALTDRAEAVTDRWISGGRVRGQALLRQLALALDVPSRERQAELTVMAVRRSLDVSWVRLRAGDLVVTDPTPLAARGGERPSLVVPLMAAELAVGTLECGPRHGGWGAAEAGEIELLARHAGLALHSAALTARLEAQVAELAASRSRIVHAELDVRRRFERELHDGVQQQVVALIAHLGALRVLLPDGSPEWQRVLVASEQARRCLVELREVVDGVHPAVLLDRGLAVAVESRAALLPLAVAVEAAEPDRRYPPAVEAAAYYVVSEALTNVVKHAGAERARVLVAVGPADLVVEVADDGRGLDGRGEGNGLRGLRDRVEALDGTLTLVSPGLAGRGIRLTARLPWDEGGTSPSAVLP